MKIKTALAFLMLLSSKKIVADELDDFKRDAQQYYDEMKAGYQIIGINSHILAEKSVGYAIQASLFDISSSFNYTFESMFYSFDKVNLCLQRQYAVAASLDDFIKDEPTDPKAREQYWVSSYGLDVVSNFTNALNTVESNYANCANESQIMMDMIKSIAKYKTKKIGICERVKENLDYSAISSELPIEPRVALRLKKDWFKYVPLLTVENSIIGEGCPQVSATKNCFSTGDITWNAIRSHESIDNSMKLLESYYPELVVAGFQAYQSYIRVMNGLSMGMPVDKKKDDDVPGHDPDPKPSPVVPFDLGSWKGNDTIQHMGGINIVANLVWIAYTIAKTDENNRKIDRLKQWIKTQESELDAVISASYIQKNEFEKLRDDKCLETVGEFEEKVNEIFTAYRSEDEVKKLSNYFIDVRRLQTWFDGLFLALSAKGVLDASIQNRMTQQRLDLFANLNTAKVNGEVGRSLNEVDRSQEETAKTRCVADDSSGKVVRDLKRFVNRYKISCNDAATVFSLQSDAISIGTGPDYARCIYQGLGTEPTDVVISNGDEENTSNVSVVGSDGREIFRLDSIKGDDASESKGQRLGIVCRATGSATFGTTSSNRLKPGKYALKPSSAYGISNEMANQMRLEIRRKGELIKTKIQRCNRTLGLVKPIPVPSGTTCEIIGG